jgi:hypothetical protein
MHALRALIRDHRRLALVVLALAFVVRAATPPGYMVSADAASVLTVSVCSDASGGHKVVQVVIPAKPGERGHGQQSAKDGPCAFAATAKSTLGGIDPILLALAFAFILVLGLAPVRAPVMRRAPHVRPPLRGPPARA